MLPPLECFAFQLKTKQGDSIGVGGLCHAPKAQYWVERLQVLQNLRVHNSNIVQVDMDLADALTALSNESLVVAGITLFAKNLELPDGIRTGGVIGSPNCPSYSADSTVEDLPEGFVQCAMPGGPGLAAQASKAVVERRCIIFSQTSPLVLRKVNCSVYCVPTGSRQAFWYTMGRVSRRPDVYWHLQKINLILFG